MIVITKNNDFNFSDKNLNHRPLPKKDIKEDVI